MKSMANKELLNTQMNVNVTDNKSSGSKLVEVKRVEGTPFEIVKADERGFFVALGQTRVTEPVTTYEEAEEIINNKGWDFLITVMGTVVDLTDKIKTIEKQ